MPPWLLPALTVAGSIIVAWVTSQGATRAKKLEATAAPYPALAQRVGDLETTAAEQARRIRDLEDEVHDLHGDRRIDRAWMRAALTRWPASPPTPPDWMRHPSLGIPDNNDNP